MAASTTSALEKREARISLPYILFVALLFLPSVGTCGGIGAYKASLAGSSVVPTTIDDAASTSRTAAGTYVETAAELRLVSREHLPYDEDDVIVARGATLFGVVGHPNLVVYCEGADCSGLDVPAAQARLRGQVCKGDEKLLCGVPKGLELYLRRQGQAGKPQRVLLAGATPRGNVWEAAIGIGVALLMLFGAVAVLAMSSRPRKGARLSVERSVPLRGAKEAARAALRRREGPSFRLAEEGADHVTFLVGAEASKARLMGVKSPADVSRRVAVRFEEQAAYRSVLATVTVTEILPFARGVPPPLKPLVQTALDQTLAEVEQVLAQT